MMNKNSLKALAFVAALAAAGSLQAMEVTSPATTGLDSCVNGDVSTSGRFPTQAMEDQYNRYMDWVAENNLDVTHAIDPRIALLPRLWPAQILHDHWAGAIGCGPDTILLAPFAQDQARRLCDHPSRRAAWAA